MVSTNPDGSQVVLARFPSEGKTLEVFGLNSSDLKSIAIPNDLQEWPTTALNKCTNLESISVYGEEVDEGFIDITEHQGLYNLSNLQTIQLPSTVSCVGRSVYQSWSSILPQGIKSLTLSKSMTSLGYWVSYNNSLSLVDFTRCRRLKSIRKDALRGTRLPSLDLSHCKELTEITGNTFFYCNQLKLVIFPGSLTKIGEASFETGATVTGNGRGIPSPVKAIVWKGRTTRPLLDDGTGIHSSAFVHGKPLDQLVTSGAIVEIFVP